MGFKVAYIRPKVSTHSRLKAAGYMSKKWGFVSKSFNTQPPEGGWPKDGEDGGSIAQFQHTAA